MAGRITMGLVAGGLLGLAYCVGLLAWTRFVGLEWQGFMATWRGKTDAAKAYAERHPSLEGLKCSQELLDESEKYGKLADLLMREADCWNPVVWARVWWGRAVGRPSRLDRFHWVKMISFRQLTQEEQDYTKMLTPTVPNGNGAALVRRG